MACGRWIGHQRGVVRDMILEAVESRFGALQSPAPLEWLTDNGSAYTAKETRDFATALNLIACFTPVQSPESNGLSESFVKTFKRDYRMLKPGAETRRFILEYDRPFAEDFASHNWQCGKDEACQK